MKSFKEWLVPVVCVSVALVGGFILGLLSRPDSRPEQPIWFCGTITQGAVVNPVGVGVIDEMSFELKAPGKIVLRRSAGPCKVEKKP